MIQNPAISSFASVNGPSTTVRLLPEYLMRAPFELGLRPDASSSTPAFTSSSLYFAISARTFSSGIAPASDSRLAFTIIMNRMSVSFIGNEQPVRPSVYTSNGIVPDRQSPDRARYNGMIVHLVDGTYELFRH